MTYVGRFRVLPLMMTLCVLTGCAGKQSGDDTLPLEIRGDYLRMTSCQGQAAMTAHYGERAFDCVLDFSYDVTGGGVITVVEPELAAGIQARVFPDSLYLSYDGVSLETGPLTPEGISPLEALPTLFRAVTGGCMAAWGVEEEGIRITFRDGESPPGDGLETVILFEKDTHAPLWGELYWDGTLTLSVQMKEFSWTREEDTLGTSTNEDMGGDRPGGAGAQLP